MSRYSNECLFSATIYSELVWLSDVSKMNTIGRFICFCNAIYI